MHCVYIVKLNSLLVFGIVINRFKKELAWCLRKNCVKYEMMSDPSCSNSLLKKAEAHVFKKNTVKTNKNHGQGSSNPASTDLSKLSKNMNIGTHPTTSSGAKSQDSPAASPKSKNAQRKEKKRIQIPVPESQRGLQITDDFHNAKSINVHELFQSQIMPLYATTNSRYLENLAHHSQLNQIQGHHTRDIIQMQLATVTTNLQHNAISPEPKYLQNVMQHPLLKRDHEIINQVRAQHIQSSSFSSQSKGTPQKESPRQKNRKRNNREAKEQGFDPYMSIEEVEKGLKSNTLIEGVLRINPRHFTHAYVASSDRGEQDVLIEGIKSRNRALEGDVVIVQLIEIDQESTEENNECKQKQGIVVFIKEKVHKRTCIGSLKLMSDKNKQRALFVPRDFRVPKLNISVLYWPDNFYEKAAEYENTLFLAEIIDWFDVRFALGKIVCIIGTAGDMLSETKAILAQNDLDVTPYGSEFKHLYPGLDYVVSEEEIKDREDCRNLCIFSIDPHNCRDVDDAVSCRKLENGNYEIGVHISDVSHYLAEGTPLDEKVADKATTIYMVEKAYHMLPDDLCMLCSLLPAVDKLAFSVFWEITPDAQVLKHRFSKTVINSCCKLAYEHAQDILDDKENIEENFAEIYNGFKYSDIHEAIKVLGHMSSIFRQRRFDGGALRIDQLKITFKLGPTGLPETYSIYESRASHQLIEEFMLLANMTVAERIYEDHPKLAFLRCHPPPSLYLLKQLAKSLKPMGIDLSISSAGELHKSLLPYVGPENTNIGRAMVINMLCTKPMTRAKYFCAGSYEEEFSHYALNVPLYTHFTSPIRRYADIMVHRLLSASLKYSEVPKWETDRVRMIAARCNQQKYNAKKAGESSTELYTLKYIELNSPVATEAVVVDVREKYLDVIIIAMGLNRRIFLNNDFPGECKCIKNDAGLKLSKMEISWKTTEDLPCVKQVIEVFSILEVEMLKGDDMVKVETKLKRPMNNYKV
ncbi:DIS3-like exonuclease 2 [Aricia agestis]|uniref:DIS3-like exonuclease 2 n=1 Tax=Aricia agestis TaxID=91739 RepID=UPI001C206A55|nr:DIS3-like exonuclease 2 [Aricia agestis]